MIESILIQNRWFIRKAMEEPITTQTAVYQGYAQGDLNAFILGTIEDNEEKYKAIRRRIKTMTDFQKTISEQRKTGKTISRIEAT